MNISKFALFFATVLPLFVHAAEYVEPGPVVRNAFKGMRRAEGALTPDSEAPFISVRFGSQCSPTYITNDGYFLIALHCLSTCLQFGGEKHDIREGAMSSEDVTKDGAEFRLIHLDQVKAKKIVCDVEGPDYVKDGYASIKPSGLRARIVSLGSSAYISEGNYFDLAFKHADLFKSLVAQGYDGLAAVGDFALLKMDADLTPDTARPERVSVPGQCLPLARENATPGTKIWSLNFPWLERKNRNTSYDPLVSAGQILQRGEVSGLRPDGPEFAPEEQATSLDVDEGASGATYFDEQGRIRGILVVSGGSTDQYVRGAAIGIGIGRILDGLRADLGAEFVTRLLNGCELTTPTQQILNEIVKTSP